MFVQASLVSRVHRSRKSFLIFPSPVYLLLLDPLLRIHRLQMSTITSPRLSTTSLTQTTPSSSRRPSLDNPTRSQTSSPSRPAAQAHPQQRRNRAALRDYYGLKATAAAAEDAGGAAGKEDEGVEVPASELDREGFDPEAYVKELLETEGLEGVLRVEGRLVNGMFWTPAVNRSISLSCVHSSRTVIKERRLTCYCVLDIRALDGEKKALVYDNYSKLISATDTIRNVCCCHFSYPTFSCHLLCSLFDVLAGR